MGTFQEGTIIIKQCRPNSEFSRSSVVLTKTLRVIFCMRLYLKENINNYNDLFSTRSLLRGQA